MVAGKSAVRLKNAIETSQNIWHVFGTIGMFWRLVSSITVMNGQWRVFAQVNKRKERPEIRRFRGTPNENIQQKSGWLCPIPTTRC
ncbi:MAG: hypothetical protein DUD39_17070 [Coriobacteriaceae bacterium]|nr:MAG: hypothetical protein DUD39_17070 [Coriobacteriaceae bacterium]